MRISVVVGIVLGVVLAVGGTVSGSDAVDLTLEEAQQKALSNSEAVILAALDVEEAELQYRQAEAGMIMQPSPVMLIQAQAGLDLANQAYIMARDELTVSVQESFYGVLRLQNLMDIAKEGLASAKRHASVTESKYRAGTVTRLDVIQSTRQILDSEAQLTQLRHGLELALMQFRQTIGTSLTAAVYPLDTEFEFEPIDVDLEADIAFALEHREEIQQLQTAIEAAAKNVELADNEYTPPLELAQAKVGLARAETQLEQVQKYLVLEIRQAYSQLKEAEERIPVLEKGVEEAAEMRRLSERMYEADMLTTNELADANLGVLSAQNELVNAIADYNEARSRYAHVVATALRP